MQDVICYENLDQRNETIAEETCKIEQLTKQLDIKAPKSKHISLKVHNPWELETKAVQWALSTTIIIN